MRKWLYSATSLWVLASMPAFSQTMTLEEQAAKGNPAAILNVAGAYADGVGVKQDSTTAQNLLKNMPASASSLEREQAIDMTARIIAQKLPEMKGAPAVPEPSQSDIAQLVSNKNIQPVDVPVRQGANREVLRAFRDSLMVNFPDLLNGTGVDFRPIPAKTPRFEMVITGIRNPDIAHALCGLLKIKACILTPRNTQASTTSAPLSHVALGGVVSVPKSSSATLAIRVSPTPAASQTPIPVPALSGSPLDAFNVPGSQMSETEKRLSAASLHENTARMLADQENNTKLQAEQSVATARIATERLEADAKARSNDALQAAQVVASAKAAEREAEAQAEIWRHDASIAQQQARSERRARQNIEGAQQDAEQALKDAQLHSAQAERNQAQAMDAKVQAERLLAQAREDLHNQENTLVAARTRLSEFEDAARQAKLERDQLESSLKIAKAEAAAAHLDAEKARQTQAAHELEAERDRAKNQSERAELNKNLEALKASLAQAQTQADEAHLQIQTLKDEATRNQHLLSQALDATSAAQALADRERQARESTQREIDLSARARAADQEALKAQAAARQAAEREAQSQAQHSKDAESQRLLAEEQLREQSQERQAAQRAADAARLAKDAALKAQALAEEAAKKAQERAEAEHAQAEQARANAAQLEILRQKDEQAALAMQAATEEKLRRVSAARAAAEDELQAQKQAQQAQQVQKDTLNTQATQNAIALKEAQARAQDLTQKLGLTQKMYQDLKEQTLKDQKILTTRLQDLTAQNQAASTALEEAKTNQEHLLAQKDAANQASQAVLVELVANLQRTADQSQARLQAANASIEAAEKNQAARDQKLINELKEEARNRQIESQGAQARLNAALKAQGAAEAARTAAESARAQSEAARSQSESEHAKTLKASQDQLTRFAEQLNQEKATAQLRLEALKADFKRVSVNADQAHRQIQERMQKELEVAQKTIEANNLAIKQLDEARHQADAALQAEHSLAQANYQSVINSAENRIQSIQANLDKTNIELKASQAHEKEAQAKVDGLIKDLAQAQSEQTRLISINQTLTGQNAQLQASNQALIQSNRANENAGVTAQAALKLAQENKEKADIALKAATDSEQIALQKIREQAIERARLEDVYKKSQQTAQAAVDARQAALDQANSALKKAVDAKDQALAAQKAQETAHQETLARLNELSIARDALDKKLQVATIAIENETNERDNAQKLAKQLAEAKDRADQEVRQAEADRDQSAAEIVRLRAVLADAQDRARIQEEAKIKAQTQAQERAEEAKRAQEQEALAQKQRLDAERLRLEADKRAAAAIEAARTAALPEMQIRLNQMRTEATAKLNLAEDAVKKAEQNLKDIESNQDAKIKEAFAAGQASAQKELDELRTRNRAAAELALQASIERAEAENQSRIARNIALAQAQTWPSPSFAQPGLATPPAASAPPAFAQPNLPPVPGAPAAPTFANPGQASTPQPGVSPTFAQPSLPSAPSVLPTPTFAKPSLPTPPSNDVAPSYAPRPSNSEISAHSNAASIVLPTLSGVTFTDIAPTSKPASGFWARFFSSKKTILPVAQMADKPLTLPNKALLTLAQDPPKKLEFFGPPADLAAPPIPAPSKSVAVSIPVTIKPVSTELSDAAHLVEPKDVNTTPAPPFQSDTPSVKISDSSAIKPSPVQSVSTNQKLHQEADSISSVHLRQKNKTTRHEYTQKPTQTKETLSSETQPSLRADISNVQERTVSERPVHVFSETAPTNVINTTSDSSSRAHHPALSIQPKMASMTTEHTITVRPLNDAPPPPQQMTARQEPADTSPVQPVSASPSKAIPIEVPMRLPPGIELDQPYADTPRQTTTVIPRSPPPPSPPPRGELQPALVAAPNASLGVIQGQAAAHAEAQRLRLSLQPLLAGASVQAEPEGNNNYRLSVHGFESRTDVARFCAQARNQGENCSVN